MLILYDILLNSAIATHVSFIYKTIWNVHHFSFLGLIILTNVIRCFISNGFIKYLDNEPNVIYLQITHTWAV